MMVSNNYENDGNISETSSQDFEISQAEIITLQNAWTKLEQFDMQIIGRQVFSHLFEEVPDLKEDFSILFDDNLLHNEKFIKHCRKVMKHIGQAIHQLDDLENLVTFVNTFDMMIDQEYFPAFIKSFLMTLKDNLQKDQFSDEERDSWKKALKLITQSIDQNMLKEKQFNSLVKQPTKRHLDILNRSQSDNKELDNSNVLDQSNQPLVDQDKDDDQSFGSDNEDIEIRQESNANENNRDSVKKQPVSRNMREVDFHHKIAYRFEKAYRLAKKTGDSRQNLNKDIIECIQEHEAFIDA